MKKRIIFILLSCILGITGVFSGVPLINGVQEVNAFSGGGEVRAVWLAYVDFSSLGLKTDSETVFRKKADQFLARAKSNNINTVCFHVRAFDDAGWKSSTFSAMSDLTTKTSSKKAASVYSFDPLKVMTELVHRKGMELHAWMNPYRISQDYYLDPAYESSTERILTAVEEVMAYDVDGIHFDDYFYHAKKGYKNRDNDKILKKSKVPSAKTQRSNVNKMVKKVYAKVKELDSSATFGISPQGNIQNCRNAGADVDTWLSKERYIDYIMPQIYWTDQWGSRGATAMYSNRLKEWKALNKLELPMYIGLASYRAGGSYKDDPGWGKKSTNLASQLNILRTHGCKGYGLFSAKDLSRAAAAKEIANLNKMVRYIPRVSVSRQNYRSLKVTWNRMHGVSSYEVYRATAKNGTYTRIKTESSRAAFTDTGVKPGKTYYYKVRARLGAKTYRDSSVASKSARPVTPTLRLAAGKRKVTVKWSSVSSVTGYCVYRSGTKNGTYRSIKRVDGKTTRFVNKKLQKGKRYYYKVRAYKLVNGKRIYSDYSSCSSRIVK